MGINGSGEIKHAFDRSVDHGGDGEFGHEELVLVHSDTVESGRIVSDEVMTNLTIMLGDQTGISDTL